MIFALRKKAIFWLQVRYDGFDRYEYYAVLMELKQWFNGRSFEAYARPLSALYWNYSPSSLLRAVPSLVFEDIVEEDMQQFDRYCSQEVSQQELQAIRSRVAQEKFAAFFVFPSWKVFFQSLV